MCIVCITQTHPKRADYVERGGGDSQSDIGHPTTLKKTARNMSFPYTLCLLLLFCCEENCCRPWAVSNAGDVGGGPFCFVLLLDLFIVMFVLV